MGKQRGTRLEHIALWIKAGIWLLAFILLLVLAMKLFAILRQ